MARDRRRHARETEELETAPTTAGMSAAAPQTPSNGKTKPARASSHPLPQDRALFLHLIRALAREAARADHAAVSTRDEPHA